MKSRKTKRSSSKQPANGKELEVFVNVNDALYNELVEFEEQKVMSFSLWDDSLTDALEEGLLHPTDVNKGLKRDANKEVDESVQKPASPNAEMFDLDLYLEGGLYFELYGASFFPQIDADPLVGSVSIQEALSNLVSNGLWLDEIAVDENEQLVLVLSQKHQPVLYLPVGGWAIEEWHELPS